MGVEKKAYTLRRKGFIYLRDKEGNVRAMFYFLIPNSEDGTVIYVSSIRSIQDKHDKIMNQVRLHRRFLEAEKFFFNTNGEYLQSAYQNYKSPNAMVKENPIVRLFNHRGVFKIGHEESLESFYHMIKLLRDEVKVR